jgi:hypothetical protein
MRIYLALLLVSVAVLGTLAVHLAFTSLCLPALALLERALAQPEDDNQ